MTGRNSKSSTKRNWPASANHDRLRPHHAGAETPHRQCAEGQWRDRRHDGRRGQRRPSLKAAHIGIAMGGRGTDVAREASSIVLLDDDFGSIVKAVRLGRRIYDNLRKAMGFIFAVHVPIAGLALLPLLFGLPIIFGPIHIAFLEMVIDPVCSLVFEAETEEDDVMRRPPRAPDEPLFSGALIVWSCCRAHWPLHLSPPFIVLAYRRGMPEPEVRALAFFSLVVAIVGLIFVNRSFSASLLTALRRPNATLAAVLFAVAVILALTLLWPLARTSFALGRCTWTISL